MDDSDETIVRDIEKNFVKEMRVRDSMHKVLYLPWDSAQKFSQRQLIHALSRMIEQDGLSFPFKRFFVNDVRRLFDNLRTYSPSFAPSNKPFRIPNIFFHTRLFDFKFDRKDFMAIVADVKDYDEIDVICDYFQEKQRLLASRKHKKKTLVDMWHSRDFQTKLLTTLWRDGCDFCPQDMRETLYKLAGQYECTQFKPSFAISVFKFLSASRILDFSAGWGDRLIAALAYNPLLYVAVDPNTALKDGHSEIMSTFANVESKSTEGNEMLCATDNLRHSKWQIIYSPFQTVNLPDDMDFDLVFTSPPFFDFERYTTESGQSIDVYPEFSSWAVKFLFFSLRKAWEHLRRDGHLVIHITDVYDTRICEAMNLYIMSYLPCSYYRGVIASIGEAEKPRPAWCWKYLHRDNVPQRDRIIAMKHLSVYYPEMHEMIRKGGDRRWAFVTLVMMGDAYVGGAMALGWSIRLQGSSADLVVLVTPDVSSKGRAALSLVFDHVKEIQYIETKARTGMGKRFIEMYGWLDKSFTKLRVLELGDLYDKVILLDADMLAVRNPDHLYWLPTPAGICSTIPDEQQSEMNGVLLTDEQYEASLESYGIRGCLYSFAPSRTLLTRFMKELAECKAYGDEKRFIGPDELFIAECYKGKWHHAHQKYGCTAWHTHKLKGEDPVFLHFVSQKPWSDEAEDWPDFRHWYNVAGDLITKKPKAKEFFSSTIVSRMTDKKRNLPSSSRGGLSPNRKQARR